MNITRARTGDCQPNTERALPRRPSQVGGGGEPDARAKCFNEKRSHSSRGFRRPRRRRRLAQAFRVVVVYAAAVLLLPSTTLRRSAPTDQLTLGSGFTLPTRMCAQRFRHTFAPSRSRFDRTAAVRLGGHPARAECLHKPAAPLEHSLLRTVAGEILLDRARRRQPCTQRGRCLRHRFHRTAAADSTPRCRPSTAATT